MKIALSTYAGSFRLPNEVELWLLREREAYHLYNSIPVKESNFALQAVASLIEDDDVDHAGKYDGTWGYFNTTIIFLDGMRMYGLRPGVRTGRVLRDDEDLVAAIEKFDPDDLKVAEVEDEEFDIRTGRHGEYVVDAEKKNL